MASVIIVRMRLRLSILFLFLCATLVALPTVGVKANPPAQIVVSTPMEDGAIVHFVSEGETMAAIAEAYGVSMDEIRSLNGLAPTSTLIFPGEKLIIRLAPTVTITPTITPVTPRPTRTPTPQQPTRTPAPTRTAMPTLTPTPTLNPAVVFMDNAVNTARQPLLIAMVVICAAGLVWTLWSGFFKKGQ